MNREFIEFLFVVLFWVATLIGLCLLACSSVLGFIQMYGWIK